MLQQLQPASCCTFSVVAHCSQPLFRYQFRGYGGAAAAARRLPSRCCSSCSTFPAAACVLAACVLQHTAASPAPLPIQGLWGCCGSCPSAATAALQQLHLVSCHSSLLSALVAGWGRAGLGFVYRAHHAGLCVRFPVLLLSRGAGVYTSPATALLRLWVCRVGVRARRMPSFPWGVGSALDVQLRFGPSYPPR